MKYFITLIFPFLTFPLASQNIVLNHSFEHYLSCPTTPGNINLCLNWNDPTGSSSDFYDTCAIFSSNVNVPYPISGLDFQWPKSGGGMAGIVTYAQLSPNFRDYIQTQFDTLEAGKTYCVKFYCNLSNYSKYANSGIGLYLSSSQISTSPPPYLLNYAPQVYSSTVISDTLGWSEISGLYFSNGSEQYLTIGNFFDDTTTQIQQVSSLNYATYYYIDDVSIEEIKPVALQNDTTVTFCDTLLLGNNLDSASTYSWWPNKNISDTTSPNPSAWPDSTTTYYVTKTQCSSVTMDSIKITVVACDVGITEGKENFGVKVFPNPLLSQINFDFVSIDEYRVRVLDVRGVVIKSESFFGINSSINLSDIAVGIYFVEIKNSNGEICYKKILKR